MKDKEILEFIQARMIHTYHENPKCDYMVRFKKIIDSLDNPNNVTLSDEELGRLMDF